jgi:hypothetical protein
LVASNATLDWHQVAADFGQFHADPTNVALHLLTTPLGIWGALVIALALLSAVGAVLCPPKSRIGAGVAEVHPSATGHFQLWALDTVLVAFMAGLVFRGGVPTTHAAFTGFVLLVLRGWAVQAHAALASAWHSLAVGVAATLLGYALQDLAHAATGEATFQQSYQAEDQWWAVFAQHTLLLLPLCYDAALTALGVPRWEWVGAPCRGVCVRGGWDVACPPCAATQGRLRVGGPLA